MYAVPLRAVGACLRRCCPTPPLAGLHTGSITTGRSAALLLCRHATTTTAPGASTAAAEEGASASAVADTTKGREAAAATSDDANGAAAAAQDPSSASVPTPPSEATTTATTAAAGAAEKGELTTPEPEPVRWVQPAYQDPDTLPVVDEKGEYIVSRVQWPTGEIAYRTPAPVDDKLAPRFGYNVVQVRKHVSWWKYNQRYPRLSLAYINIQVLFLLGLAWLVAFLTTEYRSVTEAMRTPGAMVGEHRGKGPATNRSQKVSFEKDEMSALMDKAQNNWFDGKAEASYVGSKEYKMKKIPRPKEFSADDFRKR